MPSHILPVGKIEAALSAVLTSVPADIKRRRLSFMTALIGAIVVVSTMLGCLLYSAFRETERGTMVHTTNMARLIDTKFSDALRHSASELDDIVDDLDLSQGLHWRINAPSLDSRLGDFPEMAGLSLFDASGHLVDASQIPGRLDDYTVADPFFERLRSVMDDQPHFSPAFTDPHSGMLTMDMARVIRDERGVFKGAAVVAIDLDYVRNFLASLDVGRSGETIIRRSDDFTLVVRNARVAPTRAGPLPPGQPVRQKMESGINSLTLPSITTSTNMPRITTLRRVADYPFFVVVGLNRSEVFAGWYERAVGIGLGGVIGLAVLCLVFRSMRRSELMEAATSARLEHLSMHDRLTGLPNRLNLHNRLDLAIAQTRRDAQRLAVVFVNLDRFRTINDTLGHGVGDGLLQEVARCLAASIRSSDLVARLGGDEFVVVLTDIKDGDVAASQAERILTALRKPYFVDGHDLVITPSLGISMFPDDGLDVETLMMNADVAMSHAKTEGRNRFRFFSAGMNEATTERMALERDLRLAVARGEFLLHYQPQIDIHTGIPVGFEALVRWKHPTRGLVSPAKFIPVAEETGIILDLGEWVLREALRQLRVWRDAGLQVRRVAVNLSAAQLCGPHFQHIVRDALANQNLAPGDLELEITESTAMKDPLETIRILNELRTMGVELAMDDFGTGYSSLSYLKLLPIHRLKLDQSFVRDIETDASDAAICAGTIALAHQLGLEVVAEGAETAGQVDHIRRIGGEIVQGYFYSKPLPAEDAARFLAQAHSKRGPEMAAA